MNCCRAKKRMLMLFAFSMIQPTPIHSLIVPKFMWYSFYSFVQKLVFFTKTFSAISIISKSHALLLPPKQTDTKLTKIMNISPLTFA
jgi:hypothetical protein